MACVEFFGIPRNRAGCDSIEVPGSTLGEVCQNLAASLPQFAQACLEGDSLKSSLIANLNGREFTRDPQHPVLPGDRVLILTADVGG